MKAWLAALALVSAVSVSAVSAHPGHHHKVMGTVASVEARRFEVVATTGKTSTFVLTRKTRVLRGSAVVSPAEIKKGRRVVVIATPVKDATEDDAALVAEEVRLGAATAKAGR